MNSLQQSRNVKAPLATSPGPETGSTIVCPEPVPAVHQGALVQIVRHRLLEVCLHDPLGEREREASSRADEPGEVVL